jgi:glycosyltransferase involved in cell wall biosynthesis
MPASASAERLVSVIVPARNESRTIARLVETIRRQ